ncbi:MAG: hydantoinase/oxoprolinase family protein [Thermomicrobiales bacterium]
MARSIALGIDIGGTFTDFIAVDQEAGSTYVWKTLTTPAAPARGVLSGLGELLRHNDLPANDVKKLVHATTLITNALIERKGARTALVTTTGFADLIEIGREVRYDLYDLFLRMPEPHVPADRRFEISERIGHDGQTVRPLDPNWPDEILHKLDEAGAESVAICFLHSYANDSHERAVADEIMDRRPDIQVSVSSEVAGEIREYERFSTTVANAYVQPLASGYLSGMESRLAELDIPAPLQIMLSNGGTTTVEEASRLPVRLVESGPAAGALVAAHYARMLGESHVLAFDMGGTTAKLCAIEHGQPTVGSGLEVARVHRFKRGSGLPLRAPSIELIEIGAGGGSIARIDDLGLLTVGPDSAGADPGPACYRLGGRLPTVTDADLVLGYLNPDYFLGGEMALDVAAAVSAIDAEISGRLGMQAIEVAAGIHDVVNEMMATAAGVYIAERGQDPRHFSLIATGGAGPAHAVEVARKLGISKVIVPPSAGVASAGGLLVAPPRLDLARSLLMPLEELDWAAIDRLFATMETGAIETLEEMGVNPEQISINRSVDARYVNQGHEISVPIPDGIAGDDSARRRIVEAFNEEYRKLFGRTVDGVPVECVTWRTAVSSRPSDLPIAPAGDRSSGDPYIRRPAHFRSLEDIPETPVYRRNDLQPARIYDGPAIVEEAQSTTVVGPADKFHLDDFANLIVRA